MLFVCGFLLSFYQFDHLAWGRGNWSLCLSCLCLLAMHLSLPPGVRGWLWLLLVSFPGLFGLPFFKCMDFFTECENVAFSVLPTKGDGDVENWNRVWVRHGLLVWHTFGTVCCCFLFLLLLFFFLFLFVCLFFFHSDLPLTRCTTYWKWSSYKHRVCPFVRP